MDNESNKQAPHARSIVDAARSLGIGRSTIYELIGAKKLRTFKVGNRTLIPESELARFVASHLEACP